MKKVILSAVVTLAVVGVVARVTWSQFIDTETSESNTFAAGSINLSLDGEDNVTTARFSATDMVPGNTYDGGCVELTNEGSTAGKLSVKVTNLVSNENGLLEPETTDGDIVDTEIDPTGYDNNEGDGELWDQIGLGFCLDAGAGSHATNDHCDWDDIRFRAPGSTADDLSSTYSIKTDYDYADAKDITLDPGQSETFCTEVKFYDDQSTSWWGGLTGLTNNMAMTDDAQIDFIFGLEQI